MLNLAMPSKEIPRRNLEIHHLKAQGNRESVGLNRSLQTLTLSQSPTPTVGLFNVFLALLAFSFTSRRRGRVGQILSLPTQSLSNSLELRLVIWDNLTILITGFDRLDCIPEEELIGRESKWLRTVDSSGWRWM